MGHTNIWLQAGDAGANFSLTVAPVYNTYTEPEASFGESYSSVVRRLGTPDNTSGSMICYDSDQRKVRYEWYAFENNALSSYGVIVYSSYSSELVDFLSERYMYIYDEDGMYFLVDALTPDAVTKVVGLSVLSNGLFVGYIDGSSLSTESANRSNTNIAAELKGLIQAQREQLGVEDVNQADRDNLRRLIESQIGQPQSF